MDAIAGTIDNNKTMRVTVVDAPTNWYGKKLTQIEILQEQARGNHL